VSQGLTRKVLAEQTDLAWVTIYNLECGHQPRTTWETLTRIAQVLRVDVKKLIEDEDTEPKPKREPYPTTRPEPPGPTPPPRPTKSPTRVAEDAA